MTASLVVATWNVLHRIHAENWDEPSIADHPDERGRIAAIAELVATVLAPECAIICLQEVSGDQLAALRRALPGSHQVVSMVYPRIPRPRRGPSQLVDPTEHLVIVTAGRSSSFGRTEAAFPTDAGKGYLAIELTPGGTVVIDTHVSYGDRHAAQCTELAEVAGRQRDAVAILGDFNASRAAVTRTFGADFKAAELPEGSLSTHPRVKPSAKSRNIDHVVTLRGRAHEARVVSAEGLSDHNIVIARIASLSRSR